MSVSVIICHHKGRLIEEAVQSVLKQKKIKLEIIVVTSEEKLTFRLSNHCRIIYWPGLPAEKRNVGSRYASYDYLAFYDDDVSLDEDSVYRLYETLKKEGGMVFGKLLNMEFRNRFDEAGSFLTRSGFLWSRAESGIKDVGQYETVQPILSGKSASCMISKRTFYLAGCFHASYGILGEETDLAWRVWLSGGQVLYVPQSITFHAFNTRFKPADFYTHSRVYFNGCRNYITMLYSNLERPWRILPIHILAWIVAGFGMLLSGKARASFHIFRGLLYCFKNRPILKRLRSHAQSIRKVSDKELFKTILVKCSLSYYSKRLLRYFQVGLHG